MQRTMQRSRSMQMTKLAKLTEYIFFADAQANCSSERLRELLFDGKREQMNIAHECIDQRMGSAQTFIRARATGCEGRGCIQARKPGMLVISFENAAHVAAGSNVVITDATRHARPLYRFV
ncbi:hypothetical protein D9M69_660070 [compost metagenome]